jgi:RHS repeat-associated protein
MFVLSADNVWAINRQAIVYETMTAAGLTQLPAPTSHTYTYDNNGNTISRTNGVGTDTYTYDYENRLASANIQLGSTPGPVSYTYDADGIRTSKTSGGSTTNYLVDKNRPSAQVLVETTGATAVSYVHGDDLISMKRPTGTSYYHYDGQMSTRKLSNASQVTTDSYTYDAFGIELDHTGATVNDYKYTGEQYDPNMGFYYLRARYYSQEVGRFTTEDPFSGRIFDPISLHKYLYAHADPVMHRDPSGMFALMQFLIVSSIMGFLSGLVIGWIRGGWQEAIGAALVGAVAAPILGLAVLGGGYLIAAGFGLSVPVGLAISHSAAGLIFGALGVKELVDAKTPRQRAAAVVGLVLLVAGAAASWAAAGKQVTIIGARQDCKPLHRVPGFNVLDPGTAVTETQNTAWLSAAIRRGDVVMMRTNPTAWSNFMSSIGKSSRFNYLELPLLHSEGYVGMGPFLVKW